MSIDTQIAILYIWLSVLSVVVLLLLAIICEYNRKLGDHEEILKLDNHEEILKLDKEVLEYATRVSKRTEELCELVEKTVYK